MRGNYETIQEFLKRVQQVEESKRDYVANTSRLRMVDSDSVAIPDVGRFALNEHAHGQIASRIGIPKRFYDRIGTVTDAFFGSNLRAHTVNSLFDHAPEDRMVRTLDGTARAFLSSRYRPIDNAFILDAVMPVIREFDNAELMSSSLTDRRMYLQVTFPALEREIREGDVIRAGVTVTNSEVGAGAVDVQTTLWRLVCNNGMVGQSIFRKTHVGSSINVDDEESYRVFAQETIDAELRSYQLRLRDVMADALTESRFEAQTRKLVQAAEDRLEKPQENVQNVTRRYELGEDWADRILGRVVEEKDLTRWGVANAITAESQGVEDRDRQFDLEEIGYRIATMGRSEWKELVDA